jgi:hypothetical protein
MPHSMVGFPYLFCSLLLTILNGQLAEGLRAVLIHNSYEVITILQEAGIHGGSNGPGAGLYLFISYLHVRIQFRYR